MNTPQAENRTTRKQFVVLSRAWYGETNLDLQSDLIDIISFGIYALRDGFEEGCVAEALFEFCSIGCKVQVFDDGWMLFAHCPDVFEKLADLQPHKDLEAFDELDKMPVSVDDVCRVLLECGFADATPTERTSDAL